SLSSMATHAASRASTSLLKSFSMVFRFSKSGSSFIFLLPLLRTIAHSRSRCDRLVHLHLPLPGREFAHLLQKFGMLRPTRPPRLLLRCHRVGELCEVLAEQTLRCRRPVEVHLRFDLLTLAQKVRHLIGGGVFQPRH